MSSTPSPDVTRLLRAWRDGDRTAFDAVARETGVTHLLVRGQDIPEIERNRGRWLRPAFRTARLVVYERVLDAH